MSPKLKTALQWVGGLGLVAFGLYLLYLDAETTEAGKVSLHTINVAVSLGLAFAGGFIIDPSWAVNLATTLGGLAGKFIKGEHEG